MALDTMIDRLAEDHQNARRLAQGLANIDGLSVDPESIQSNIVFFDVDEELGTAADLIAALKNQGGAGVVSRQTVHTDGDAPPHHA